MTLLEYITSQISDYLYVYAVIILLIFGGLYFTIRTKGLQLRTIREQIRVVGEKPVDKNGVSSFSALMVSTASRVGTGNIVGVATAICVGGFGAVFWMWVIAIIGCASAFVESTLAQIYKKRGPGGCYGGPAYYIETALKCRPLAIVFSIFLILTYGVGFNMVGSYNLQSTFKAYSFYNESVSPWIIGGIIAVAVAYCLFGGGKRVLKITDVMVPVMGVAYILVAVVVVCLNAGALPYVFKTIFKEAFDFRAIFGGFGGSCIMQGIRRGLFSNEAGVGSAPNASASADISHPAKQGLVQMLSVFIDTIIVCTATAFMCMTSGVSFNAETDGAVYVQESLRSTLGEFGPIFITVAMLLFAFTTFLGNLYYVTQALKHIINRIPGKVFNTVYYIVAALFIFVGAGLSAGLLWNIADITMGLMVLINIPVIIILGKYAFRALKDYFKQRRAGKNPEFHAESIGLPHDVDYWK